MLTTLLIIILSLIFFNEGGARDYSTVSGRFLRSQNDSPTINNFDNIAKLDKGSSESWTTPDKFDHLLGSAILSGSEFLALKVTHNNIESSAVFSFGSVFCLGVLKELYDLSKPNRQASWKDLAMDLGGALLGVMVAYSL